MNLTHTKPLHALSLHPRQPPSWLLLMTEEGTRQEERRPLTLRILLSRTGSPLKFSFQTSPEKQVYASESSKDH